MGYGVEYIAVTSHGEHIVVAPLANTYRRLHLSSFFESRQKEWNAATPALVPGNMPVPGNTGRFRMPANCDIFLNEQEQIKLGTLQRAYDIVDHGWFEVVFNSPC